MSLRVNLLANYLGQGWRALMGIVFVPLYVHYLGIEAYGLVGVFTMLQAGLSLVDVGMRPSLSREMARFTAGRHDAQSIRTLLRSVSVVGLGLAVAVALAISASSVWIATNWLHLEALSPATVVHALIAMGVVIGLRIPENIYVSAVAGLQRQVIHNVVTSVMATVRALGALVLLAYMHGGIEVFFFWQGLVSLMTACAMALVIHSCLPPAHRPVYFSLQALRGVWRFAAGMTTIAVLALLSTQMDKVLLSRMLPLSLFSYYVLAGTVASVLYSLTGPINAAYNPRLAELAARDDQTSLCATYHQGAQLVSVVMGPAAIMLMVFADRLVQVWTGNPQLTEHVSGFVPILALSVLLNGLVNMPYQLQLAYGWTRLAALTSLGAAVFIGPAVWLLVPRFGAVAAAWSGVAVNAAYMIFNVGLMHRRLLKTERRAWYVRDVALPLSAAALMACALRLALPAPINRIADGLIMLAGYALCLLAALCAAPEMLARVVVRVHAGWRQTRALAQLPDNGSGNGSSRR